MGHYAEGRTVSMEDAEALFELYDENGDGVAQMGELCLQEIT